MFKKLRDKITEEVQQTSLRLPVSVQQLSQLSPFSGSGGENSEPSKSPHNEPQDELLVDISEIQPAGDNKDLFSIDEDSGEGSPSKIPSAFQVVELGDEALASRDSPERETTVQQHVSDPFDPSATPPTTQPSGRRRKSSEGSTISEVGGLFPIYEVPGVSFGVPQSDLESCSSEWEDNAGSLDRLSKDTVYQAYLRVRQRYHKYKGRYSDIVRAYQEKEKETSKLRDVLTKTQDKAMRRVSELREQCSLEQQAKAHLEQELRSDLEERDHKISALQTKVRLLQEGCLNDVQIKSATIAANSHHEGERSEEELSISQPLSSSQGEDLNLGYSHSLEDGDNVSVGSLGSISTAPTSLETDELIEKLKGDLIKHKTLLSRCMENIRMNKEKISSLSQERDQATSKLQEMTDSMELIKADHAKELQSLRASVESSALSMAETKQQLFKEFQAKEVEAELFKQRAAELELTVKSLQEQLEDTKRDSADEEQEICMETKLEHSETTSELSLSFRESELKCSELEKLVAELQDTTKSLEMKADELNRKNLSLEEALKNEKNKEHTSDSNKTEEELNKLREENTELDQNYKDAMTNLSSSKSKCEELVHQMHSLKLDYDRIMAEKEKLNTEMVRLSNAQAEKLQLNTDKINEMVKENTLISSERDSLLEQLDKISKEKGDPSQNLSSLQQSFDELNIQNNLINEKYAKLQNDVTSNNKTIESLRKELDEKSTCQERELQTLKESWESRLEEKDSCIIALEKETQQLNLECSTEKEVTRKLKSQLQNLEHKCDSALAEVESVSQTLKEKDQEIDQTKLGKEELEVKLKSLESSYEETRELLKCIKVKITPFSDCASIKNENLTNLIEKCVSDKCELEKKVANLEVVDQEHKAKAKQLEDQLLQSLSEKEKFAVLSAENDSLSTSLKNAEEELRKKDELLKEGEEKILRLSQEFEEKLSHAETEVTTLKQQLESSQVKLEACQAKLEETTRNADYLQKINAKMKSSAQEKEEKLTLMKESCLANENCIKTLEGKVVHLVAEKKEIIDEFNSKISELEGRLTESREETKKTKKNLEAQMEDAKEEFTSQEKKMKDLLNSSNNEKSALESALTSLQEEKATLHTVIEQNEAFISTLKEEHLQKLSEVRDGLNHDWSLKLEELQGDHAALLASTKTALAADAEKARAQFEKESVRLSRLLEEKDEAIVQLREDSAVHLATTMDQQAQQHQQEIERLRGLLAERERQLETQVRDMEMSNADLRQRIESLQNEISLIDQQCKEDFSQAEKRHREEKICLQNKMESEKRSLEERLTSEKVVMEEQLTADKRALEELLEKERHSMETGANNEIQSLSEKLKSMSLAHKTLVDKIEQLEAKNSETTHQLQSVQTERDEAKKHFEEAQSEKQKLLAKEGKLGELENQVKSITEEKDKLLAEIEKNKQIFQTEKQALEEDALKSKTTLQDHVAKRENEEALTKANSVIGSLSEQVEALKEEQKNYLALIQELQANCSETTSKLNATDQEKNQLKKNLEELIASKQSSGTDEAKVQDKLLELEGQMQALKSENARLLEDLEKSKIASSPEKAALQTATSDATASNEESLRLFGEIERLKRSSERAVAEERTINEALKVECNFFKGEIERVKKSYIAEQAQTELLKEENALLRGGKEVLDTSPSHSVSNEKEREEISSLSEKVRLLNEENTSYKNRIDELGSKFEETTVKLTSTEGERDAMKASLNQLNSEKEDWVSQNSNLIEKNASLESSLQNLLQEKKKLSEELDSSKQESSVLTEQVTTLTNNITNLQKQIECLIQTSNHSASELASTQNRCSHLEGDLKQLSCAKDELQKQLQEATAQVSSLSSHRDELSSKLEALSSEAQLGERVPLLEKQVADLQATESNLKASLEASNVEAASLRSSISSLEATLGEEKTRKSQLEEVLCDLRSACRTVCGSLAEREDPSYFKDVVLTLSRQRDEITKQLSEELISKEQLACQLRQEGDKSLQLSSSLNDRVKEMESLNAKLQESEEKSRLISSEKEESIRKLIAEKSTSELALHEKLKENETLLTSKHKEELARQTKDHEAKLREAASLCATKVNDAVQKREEELQQRMDQLTEEWNKERKELGKLTQVATAAFKTGTDSVDLLKKQVASQRKEIDEMKHSHRKEVSELQALLDVKRRRGKQASAAGSLEDAAEFDYLRNILFEYMLGKETQTLCKVLCAVVKFDRQQQQQILDYEERKQSLKRLEAVRQSDNIDGDQHDLPCLR